MFMTDQQADAIVRELGATPAPTTRDGVRTAMQFLDRHMPEKSRADRLSYLKAIDLSKPVRIVDLLKGEEVAGFRHPVADFGEFYTRIGSDPAKLGILLHGRQFRKYEVLQRVAALSSHTSAFKQMALGPGGAPQLLIPRAALVLRVIQRGIGTR